MNLRHTWFRQNSAHLLIISNTLFQNIFPNNNLKAPLQGELTKYLSSSSDTKKHLSLSHSASTARPFSIDTDHDYDKSETIPMSLIIGFNNFHSKKQPAWFYQRRKYRFSQLHKYRKSICAFFRQTPMCEILGQSHWCSKNSISRIKILISNPQVPNMKTCPKSLNYRYAGFQNLDWNANFQSSLVRTADKLLLISTHQDLFTIKNSIHKIYCLL